METPAAASRRFQLVDVFGDTPFSGNPVAVVLDGGGLATPQMRKKR